MEFLFAIVQEIIAPILALLFVGGMLQRIFKFDLRSFSHLLTYALLPAAVFISLYESVIDGPLIVQLILYLVVFNLALIAVSEIGARALKLDRDTGATFKNSVVLMNSGNYGVPVSQMIFATQPIGVSIQIIATIAQNVVTYTYGLYNLISTSKSGLDILRELFRLPIIHALWIGSLLNYLQWQLPIFIELPIRQMADGFLPLALLLLGAQLAQIEFKAMFQGVIYWSSFLRLIISPAIAFLLILLFKLDGVVAKSLFIGSSFPTSRNSSTLAFEYDVNPDLAAQIVLFSTILSAITVTIFIYIAELMWG